MLGCAIAVFEPRPEVRIPGRFPASFARAMVDSSLERDARCFSQVGRTAHGNFIGGKQGEQMRDVAHSRFVFFVVFAPLLQLTVLSDLEIRDALECRIKSGAITGIDSQDLRGVHGGMEECIDDLVIHRGADRLPAHRSIRHAIAVFRRIGRVCDQMALTVVDEEVEKKLRGFLHDGVGFAAQESAI